jgi:hypothetical protein
MQRKEEKFEKVKRYVESCEDAVEKYIPNNPETFEKLITLRDTCGFFKKFLDSSKKVDHRTHDIEHVILIRDSRKLTISFSIN